MTLKDLVKNLTKEEMNKEICPDCYHILEITDDELGKYLYCPNEMCLNETKTYLR